MNNNYSEAYRDYYDKIRMVSKGKKSDKMNIGGSSKEDIYPSMRNVGNYSYKRGSYGGVPGGSYGSVPEKKKSKYIDRFIFRLILTFVLFLGVFILKITPSDEAKEFYSICKAEINKNIDYMSFFSGIDASNINYNEILKNIEDKYSDIIESIKLEDFNEALNL